MNSLGAPCVCREKSLLLSTIISGITCSNTQHKVVEHGEELSEIDYCGGLFNYFAHQSASISTSWGMHECIGESDSPLRNWLWSGD